MNIKKYDILNKNRSRFYIFSLIITGLLLSGCWQSDTGKKDSKLMVINVLDKSYFEDCHITGSISITFEELETRMSKMDKSKDYVLYCSNYACMAAPTSVKMMQNIGFKDVAVYPGGIVEWYQKKYPYQGPATMEYLKDENEPLGEDDDVDVPTVSAEALLEKMKKADLLS